MPEYRVTCHKCFKQPIVIFDTPPVFCPLCSEDIRPYVTVLTEDD
jgi:rRNA maturation endonuclease Nob1